MHRLIILFLFLVMILRIFAQNDPLAGQDTLVLENERIEDVIDSEKPFLTPPSLSISPPSVSDFDYNSLFRYLSTDFDPAPPDIKTLDPVKPSSTRHNMVKLSMGRYITPRLDLFLNNGADQVQDYGLNFTHASAHNDEVTYRKYREDFATVYGSVQSGYNQYGGALDVYNTSYFNYGDTLANFAETLEDGNELETIEDSIRMGFTRVQLSGYLKSLENPELPYHYNLGARLRYYADRRENTEFHVTLRPRGELEFNKKLSLEADLEYTYTRADIGLQIQNRQFFWIIPAIVFDNQQLRLRGGIIFNAYNNDRDPAVVSHFSPIGEASYELFPDELTITAGYLSGMVYNHYYDMIDRNRFMSKDVRFLPSIEKWHIYGGVKGRIAQRVDYAARVFFSRVEDALVFTVEPDDAYFTASYDSLVETLGVTGEVIYQMTDELRIGGNVTFRNFNMSELERYFHETPLRVDGFARYTWDERLTAEATLALFNRTPMSVDATDELIFRPSLALLNISGSFKITDQIFIHLNVYNILNTSYERWLNYDERPVDISGGFSVTF